MFREGDTFEGLELIKQCGSGAFGTVFLCKDVTGKKMAVKIIHKSRFNTSWEREFKGVKNYRRLSDSIPELLRIYHVQDQQEHFYYTMEPADSLSPDPNEYLPDTLASRLQKGPLPEKDLFSVLYQVFKGVKVLHDNNVAHRDIKPENIIFVNGTPKLGDIGLVSSLTFTMTQMAGTPAYLPRDADPSQLQDPAACRRNDLYALGKVIYCAVTGNAPEKFPSLPPTVDLTPAVKHFRTLANDLCHTDPEQRISSTGEVLKEFRRIKKILHSGGNFLDEGNHAVTRSGRFLRALFASSGMWLSKYGWILLMIILLVLLFSRK